MDFKNGFILGAGILGTELAFFFGRMIIDKFNEAIPLLYSSPEIDSIYTNTVLAFLIISLSGYLAGFVIGVMTSTDFAVGYILGDYFILVIFGYAIWPIAPSIVISMALIPISVILGIYFKNRS